MEKFPFTIINNILIGEEVSNTNKDVNIGKLILNALKSQPDFVAQVDTATGEEITFQKIRNRSVKLAIWMKIRGICPGDLIGISSRHYDVMYIFLASLYIGAIPVLWHEKHLYESKKSIIVINVLKMLFIHDIFAIMLYNDYNIKELKIVPIIIVFGVHLCSKFLIYDILMKKLSVMLTQKKVDDFYCGKLDESKKDTATILYTRAITSLNSKGVKISHTTFMAAVNQQVFDLFYGDTGMWIGSLSSFINLVTAVYSILSYKRTIVFEGYRIKEICEVIEKYKVNWVLLETYMCRDIVNYDLLKTYNFTSVKTLIFSGSPISYNNHQRLIMSLPNATIISLYSTTETGIISCQAGNGKVRSSGYVGNNIQLKIVDLDNGESLGPYKCGEIWCRCKDIMNAYHNYHQSSELIDENGWHHTGDFGYYDKDGEIFVEERISNFIFYKDLKISPTIIENVISRHNSVDEVAVVPMIDENDCEHAFAYITSKRRRWFDVRDLINEVAGKLDDHFYLRGGAERLHELPYALDGNIDRIILRNKANEDIYF